MTATLDAILASASRLAGDRLMIVAASGHVLTLRRDDETKIHDLPRLDQIDVDADFESQYSKRGSVRLGHVIPWTGNTWRVDAEVEFKVPGVPDNLCLWTPPVIPLNDAPQLFTDDVITALRHDDAIFTDVASKTANKSGATNMSNIQDLQRQLDALKRQIGPPSGDPQEFRQAQVRADAVYRAFGDSAPPFASTERLTEYRARLLKPYLKYSKRWQGTSVAGLNDSVLEKIEAEVYADAMTEAKRPTQFKRGELRPVVTMDGANRPITHYVGDPNACWDQFNAGFRYVTKFNVRGNAR